jgi:hypothetical protein
MSVPLPIPAELKKNGTTPTAESHTMAWVPPGCSDSRQYMPVATERTNAASPGSSGPWCALAA